MPMSRQERMVRDLAQHFGERLIVLVDDTFDTCRRAHLPADETISNVMFYMISGGAKIADSLHMTREQFCHLCGDIWDEVMKDRRKR